MSLPPAEILRRLGAGHSIADVCVAVGWSRDQFDVWWAEETRSRVPPPSGPNAGRSVRIDRDSLGIPHVRASSDADLFFGFGYAVAQDRLWQLDYLRRRGAGRLAEILGADPAGLDMLHVGRAAGFTSVLELDVLARTVGFRRAAEREWGELPADIRSLVTAFSDGINTCISDLGDRLPIEFALLDYRPEPWSPIDSLVIEKEFAWYLTGRFPVLVMPELIKRALGAGPFYEAFLPGEMDHESILPPGSYTPGAPMTGTSGGDEPGSGSNNWVIAGSLTESGRPLVASDPHVPFDAVSWWYEVRLTGGAYHVAGMAYTGMPAVMIGRTRHVAWGITNNICSQRDLYLETVPPTTARTETIAVQGGDPVMVSVRVGQHGPIVTDVLPPAARGFGPVSLRWLGSEHGGWLLGLLGMNRATTAAELREAMRPWHVPTFCIVYADTAGRSGFQATGRIPIRGVVERGLRPGDDPRHQWQGLIPFDQMPHWQDPPRGWVATANNRVAADDFPHPLSGTWSDGMRHARIRAMIESRDRFGFADMAAMQYDIVSPRAVAALPHLVRIATASDDPRAREAATHLAGWDGRMALESVGPTLFTAFFAQWVKTVTAARVTDPVAAALVASGANGLASRLLHADDVGWFPPGQREAAVVAALLTAVTGLSDRLGPNMGRWTWDRVHVTSFRHTLSGRGDLGTLLDQAAKPTSGDVTTVGNTGLGGKLEARTGAGCRLIADLAEPVLHVIDGQGQSGHPGSPHYRDQLDDWLAGRYHTWRLDGSSYGES